MPDAPRSTGATSGWRRVRNGNAPPRSPLALAGVRADLAGPRTPGRGVAVPGWGMRATLPRRRGEQVRQPLTTYAFAFTNANSHLRAVSAAMADAGYVGARSTSHGATTPTGLPSPACS